jgi:predicted transcriptional regulator
MSGSLISHRDRIYIIKDVILKLVEYGELNQTALVSFCGLNLKKHKDIFDNLESNELISRNEISYGKRMTAIYKPTQKGIEFCRTILEPYEKMFPRNKGSDRSRIGEQNHDNNGDIINKMNETNLLGLIII